MKNILITGGAGFIGSNLARELIRRGYNITVLDNLSSQVHGESGDLYSPLFLSIQNKVNFIKGSVTSKQDWELALESQDIVVHFAAETGTGQSMYQIEKYNNVNISGTAILLDILVNKRKFNVKKVIIASSRSIYGEGKYFCDNIGYVYPNHRRSEDMDKGNFEVNYPGCNTLLKLVATDEESKIHPSSVYGITKQVQEQLIMTVCPTIGIAPTALRYQNVFGPGQSLSNPYTGILSIFSTLIKNGTDINIFEDGLESRDFVYIDDVIQATLLSIESDKANGEIFNVGTGIPVNVLTVAQSLINAYSSSVKLKITGNYRLGDIRHNYANIDKIKNMLGFKPAYSFQDGLRKFVDWVNTQNVIHTGGYNTSLNEMKEKGLYK